MEKESMEDWIDREERTSSLFLSVQNEGDEVTVREDLYDFQTLLDAVRAARRKGIPFRLIDSGAMDFLRLEWLASEGASVYSSDRTPRGLEELGRLAKACLRGGAFLSYFLHGPLVSDGEKRSVDWSGLLRLAGEGIFLFMSSKQEKRDLEQLCALADRCRRGGSRLVYYHHGELGEKLVELARNSAWIHLKDSDLGSGDDHTLLLDIIGTGLKAGVNLVLHLYGEIEFYRLLDIQKAGATLIFHSTLLDYRSPIKPLKERASKKKLDPKAFYLYSKFFF